MSLHSDRNLSDTTEKVVAEYIWFGGSGMGLRSMGMVVIGPVSNPSMLPKLNFDGSIGNLAPGEDSGVILYPQAIFKDPFRRGEDILVMCDAYTQAGWPIPANKRREADKILSHPAVVAAKPSYTIVQVYTLSRPDVSVAGPQGPYHRGIVDEAVGSYIAASLHEACRHAGISIISNKAGVPGQWEFQVGPATGISAGDKYWVARYILQRITEIAGIILSFDPNPIQQGDRNGAGPRTNYSTESMRNDGGLEAIGKAIERIGLRAKEQIWAYYVTGCRETADINKFLWQGFASRGADIGVGRDPEEAGNGSLEYSGPASNLDPYVVTSLIAETTILWKPYYELALERAWCAVERAWRAVVG